MLYTEDKTEGIEFKFINVEKKTQTSMHISRMFSL